MEFNNSGSCARNGHAAEKGNILIQCAVGQNDFAVRQMIFFRPFCVGAVAKGGAHNGSRALIHADFFIRHNGNFIIIKGYECSLADIFPVSFIRRIDKKADTAAEQLGACSGNLDGFHSGPEGEVVKRGFNIPGVKLRLGNGGFAAFAPENGGELVVGLSLLYKI